MSIGRELAETLAAWVGSAADPEQRTARAAAVRAIVETPEAAPPVPRRCAKLYSPERRGYLRATVESGIRAELDAMKAEATGSPFFDSMPAPTPAAKPSTSNAAKDSTVAKLRAKLAELQQPKDKP